MQSLFCAACAGEHRTLGHRPKLAVAIPTAVKKRGSRQLEQELTFYCKAGSETRKFTYDDDPERTIAAQLLEQG